MYSELTYLKNEEKYRNLFEREYCQKEIITCHNKSSPDSCVKCYTMFLPFLLIKIDVFS